jgi:signal transduction histidine kinase/CheY-like chemotaxis protein
MLDWSHFKIVAAMSRRPFALYSIAAVFVAIVLVLLVLDYERSMVVSDVRAYIAGEGLYSKAQKRAVNLLFRYVRLGSEEYYQGFRDALIVPQGDRDARLALQKSPPDFEAARKGFLQGRNHPADVDRMAGFFVNFHKVSYVADAIAIWTQGDAEIAHLQALGAQIHTAMAAGVERTTLNPVLEDVVDTDSRLTVLEDQFSTTLGEGARFLVEVTEIAVLALTTVMLGIGLMFSLRVVGDTRRAEAALSQADRRKDEFLATLAHELRNPLAPIRTGLHVMKLAQIDPAESARALRIVDRQTELLVTLVDDLLDVSRITRGKLQLHRRRARLGELVDNAVEASQPMINEANHQLTVEVADAQVWVDADPHRLTQIISNLLNNAARYTRPGGRISLAARHEGNNHGGNNLVLTVQDTGEGIAPDMLERVFEMFTQVDRPQNFGGLGIGLTLVKSLVELHGGKVTAESGGLGKGSTFKVEMPVIANARVEGDRPPQAEQTPAPTPATRTMRRVLIVDDNADAAETLAVLVGMLGHEVQQTNSPVKVPEIAAAWQPGVILLDLGMPAMNGYEVAQQIRKQPWGENIMLVAVTGWGQEADRQRTRTAGFDFHLVKPADFDKLQAILEMPGSPNIRVADVK